MKYYIIYVPGITDDILRIQSVLIQSWRLFGVVPHIHAMPWAGPGAFPPKLAALTALIDDLHAKGHRVGLVGASAGASAVLHAYALRRDKVAALAYVAGKIRRPEAVSDGTYAENPAFKESLYTLPAVLDKLTPADKARMLSLYSKADTTVPYPDTLISGVRELRLPSLKHGWAIVYAISIGAPRMLRFLKQIPEQT